MMFPRWLSLLILVFFVYIWFEGRPASRPAENAGVVQAPIAATDPAAEKTAETQATPTEKSSALDAATDLERWKRAINPGYAAQMAQCALKPEEKPLDGPGFHVIDEAAGEGDAAYCTQTITVTLAVWDSAARGASPKPKYQGELELTLGARSVAAGIDAGLVGIKPGGKRMLILPPSTLARDKKSKVSRVLLNALPSDRLAVVTVTRVK